MTIGLTGGIASGKSAAADRFAHHDIDIIDADVLARKVVQPGQPGLAAIVKRFGEAVLQPDGQLDRGAMREHVFSDPNERRALEALLHPLIRTAMWAGVRDARSAYVVLVVPLLVENGLHRQVDRVLVVDVSSDTQRRRLMGRDGSSPQEVEAIIAAQADPRDRLAVADDVIDNNGDLNALWRQVDTLHEDYLERAGGDSRARGNRRPSA